MLTGRHIVVGVSGGVAAYKAAYLCRRLIEQGATVKVVMTGSAGQFVGPATFAAITGTHPVVDLFNDPDVSPHTTLARWADAVVIAPATASTIAKICSGDSSNALVATVLATTRPVLIAPAMVANIALDQTCPFVLLVYFASHRIEREESGIPA